MFEGTCCMTMKRSFGEKKNTEEKNIVESTNTV